MDKQTILNASEDDLFQWMKNALATTNCIGHTKGQMNERAAEAYRTELNSRGHEIGEINFSATTNQKSLRHSLMIEGTYNGAGAF